MNTVIETHPFELRHQRCIVDIPYVDRALIRKRNPELNVRTATPVDKADTYKLTGEVAHLFKSIYVLNLDWRGNMVYTSGGTLVKG